ncbi:hypothetical protein MMC30_005800 [Trapelia coarctata]|nr:hypothetical protein [Trapelia coarctata]
MASPLPPDPYKILNVPKDALLSTIRSAHRKLVLTCHPDKVYDESVRTQKADQFHQVQQAYELLSDDTRRSRYDDRVKLAELKAEMMAREGGRGKSMHDFVPRPSPTATYETRGNAIYEERAPRRSYEDEFVSPKYEDHRSAGRKYDDRYEERPSRRSSGRVAEDKRKAREYEEDERQRRAARERAEREYAKAEERSSYAERKKTREKGRRQDYDSKYYHPQVESDSDSDSDSTERYETRRRAPEPRKRQEESRRKDHDHRSRRARDDDSDYTDERETKTQYRIVDAQDYITKVSGKFVNDRRPSLSKFPGKTIHIPPPLSPPPVDFPRRSSARPRRRETSPRRMSDREKDYRTPEIVEPSSRREYENSSRRPTLPTATSEPAHMKIPSPHAGIHRATTDLRSPPESKPPASIRRSQTTPLSSMLPGHREVSASKSSKGKSSEIHDSGYSSPGTPELQAGHSPIFKSTKLFAVRDLEDKDDEILSPRVREISPRAQHRSERPSGSARASSSARPPPSRSATYAAEPPPSGRPGAFVRTHSSRPSPTSPAPSRLFGEVVREIRSPSYKVQNQSPKLQASDIKYATYAPRRGSADSPRDHRDAYAYGESRSARGAHPGMGGRGGSYVQQEAH